MRINSTYGLVRDVSNLFNDLVNDDSFYNWTYKSHLSSKVEQNDNGYAAQVEVPGYNKENLSMMSEIHKNPTFRVGITRCDRSLGLLVYQTLVLVRCLRLYNISSELRLLPFKKVSLDPKMMRSCGVSLHSMS